MITQPIGKARSGLSCRQEAAKTWPWREAAYRLAAVDWMSLLVCRYEEVTPEKVPAAYWRSDRLMSVRWMLHCRRSIQKARGQQ